MNQLLRQTFSGVFTFQRVVNGDHLTSLGRVLFENVSPHQTMVSEKGVHLLPGKRIPFYQKRIFELYPTTLTIRSADGSILHDFSTEFTGDKIPLRHLHLCKQDTYDLTIHINSENNFSFLYTIKGPCKDLNIYTEYKRKI